MVRSLALDKYYGKFWRREGRTAIVTSQWIKEGKQNGPVKHKKNCRSDLSSVTENTKQSYEKSSLVHRNIILTKRSLIKLEKPLTKVAKFNSSNPKTHPLIFVWQGARR